MSEISSFSRISGSGGTAAVRALEKTPQTRSQTQHDREVRVTELKKQYQSGLYIVDTVQLSSAIVGDLLSYSR